MAAFISSRPVIGMTILSMELADCALHFHLIKMDYRLSTVSREISSASTAYVSTKTAIVIALPF